MGVEQTAEGDIGIVAFDYFGLGLKCAYHALDASQFGGADFRDFVEQNDVAKLNLLYDKVFDVLIVDVGFGERLSAAKLILKSQRIDHGDYAVEMRCAERCSLDAEPGYGADGLGDGGGFAYTAGLDNYVVKPAHSHDVFDLFHEVHLEGAADAAVRESHEAVVFGVDYAAALYERSVDVNLAYVVDYHGKFDAALVGEDMVYQSGFTAAEITGEQEYGDIFIHDISNLLVRFTIR